MNVQNQIAKLEALLGRIRQNAGKARLPAAVGSDEGTPQSLSPATARAEPLPATLAAATPPPAPETPRPAPVLRTEARPLAAAVIAEPPPAPAEIEELDMGDTEMVELAGQDAAGATEVDLDADLGAEEIPESAPRPAAQAMGEEVELEAPVITPPPESGRQAVAAAPLASFEDVEEVELTGSGDVDDLLEADLGGGPISRAQPGGPTMEQLGETVELEGADAPSASLELASSQEESTESDPDELELSLPNKQSGGMYDASLAPPREAAADLERHEVDQQRRADAVAAAMAPAPVSLASPPSLSAMSLREAAGSAGPTVVERPPVVAEHVSEIVVAKPARIPEAFLELLDASLALKA